ncbi:MAG: hypothetical protein L0Z48_03490 [candidate division Zixibacteria bacterium]|nr:hypothetical protein [candidate division Zixibacteria bacterium]
MKNPSFVKQQAASQLAVFFHRNGYVRRQNAKRLAAEGHMRYKKGDEVRLATNSIAELKTIRRLLRQAGFKPGKPFTKARQWRQPVYGREAVARFLALVGKGAGGSGS